MYKWVAKQSIEVLVVLNVDGSSPSGHPSKCHNRLILVVTFYFSIHDVEPWFGGRRRQTDTLKGVPEGFVGGCLRSVLDACRQRGHGDREFTVVHAMVLIVFRRIVA